MKNKKAKIISIVAILMLLVAFIVLSSNGIVRINSKNNVGIMEENLQIQKDANPPRISAGMIPVKQVENYWVITTIDDNEWYDYENGIPAYIMLNDGVYQSEEYYQMPNSKKLVEENIGAQISINDTDTLGTIYMWVPRFVENTTTGEIEYLEQGKMVAGNLQTQNIFTYKTEEMDFSLSGVWVEVKKNTNASNIANNMNTEENNYGFIKNTKANVMTEEEKTSVNKFIEKILNNTQIDNTNYTILKIVDISKPEPITASISTDGQQITIDIKYTKHGIKSIINQDGDNVVYSQNGTKAIVVIGIDDIQYINQFTITDNEDNQVYLEIINNHIYAKLYNGNTLVFTAIDKTIPSLGSVTANYGDVWNKPITVDNFEDTAYLWNNKRSNITIVNFYDKIFPQSTQYWFRNNTNLKTFNNIKNLDTSITTTMRGMFNACTSLTNIDVSNFDTSNVTTTQGMFYNCSGLTSIDVSNFNTSNVTSMEGMFWNCSSLTSLNLSNFDTGNVTNMYVIFYGCNSLNNIIFGNKFNTKNVTDMEGMFYLCTNLTSINVSNFDTSKATNMKAMFYNCSSLTSLDLSSFITNNSIDMQYMFNNCTNLRSWTISNSRWKATTTQNYMFTGSQISYSKGLTRVA